MLTVEEISKKLSMVPGGAVLYLPGGGPIRDVDVREDGVFLVGDGEARGSEEERVRVDVIKEKLAEAGFTHANPEQIEKLAWGLLETERPAPEFTDAPAESSEDVSIQPGTGSVGVVGQ